MYRGGYEEAKEDDPPHYMPWCCRLSQTTSWWFRFFSSNLRSAIADIEWVIEYLRKWEMLTMCLHTYIDTYIPHTGTHPPISTYSSLKLLEREVNGINPVRRISDIILHNFWLLIHHHQPTIIQCSLVQTNQIVSLEQFQTFHTSFFCPFYFGVYDSVFFWEHVTTRNIAVNRIHAPTTKILNQEFGWQNIDSPVSIRKLSSYPWTRYWNSNRAHNSHVPSLFASLLGRYGTAWHDTLASSSVLFYSILFCPPALFYSIL